jgi:hypothetical protein
MLIVDFPSSAILLAVGSSALENISWSMGKGMFVVRFG